MTGTARESEAARVLATARMAERMGQRDAVRTLHRKLLDEYPDTEAAAVAKKKIE